MIALLGLTTAAMIWGAAGIGIAVGAGFYVHAAITVLIVVLGIEVLAPFLLKIGPKRLRMRDVSLKVRLKEDKQIESLINFLNNNEMTVDNIRIKDIPISDEGISHEVDIRFSTR